MWAVGVPDKPLEWFYPNVFVRGELNGVQGIPGDGKTWLMCELAAQTNVGGIVQGNSGDSTSFSIGSYAIAGIFRTLWTLGRLKDESGKPTAQRALCVSKNNYVESNPPALLFVLQDGFHWDGADPNIFAEDLYSKKNNKGRPAGKKDLVKSEIQRLLGGGERGLIPFPRRFFAFVNVKTPFSGRYLRTRRTKCTR
jgi:hypothetical protein